MKKVISLEKKLANAKTFEVDYRIGLNDEQVASRVNDGLTNKVAKHVSKSYWKIFCDNIINFFNVLLIIIAVFMIIAKVPFTSFAFLVILTINVGIGLFQDIRARRLTDKLKVVSYPYVSVIRNGEELTLTADKIVLSDVVILKTGAQIIADGTLLEGSIEVNESIITGESVNVVKHPGDQILSGTYVASGKCYYRVDHVGRANYAEKLQTSAKYFKKPKSKILWILNFIFKIIGFVVIFIASALIVVYIIRGQLDPSDTTGFATAVGGISGALISMIPSGMYLLTSLTFAIGAVRLANKKVLVQELYCIENLARANILCLDKTGTITDGTMVVSDLVALNGNKKELRDILLTLETATGDTNPTATAISNAFSNAAVLDYHSALPFNSERKFSAVMLKDGRSIIVGAREFIPHKDKNIDLKCEQYEAKGLRVLIITSYKQVVTPETKLSNCDVVGILVLEDHIKEDAIETIKAFNENGVKIRVISGDSPISVSTIARKAGVENADKFISLEGMSIGEVKLIANNYTVFGRVNPEQKKAIIEALKDSGNTVAMTGDGVNDILALKVADCSIAMGSGADAAKNVAHLVSIDSKFSSLPDVVSEGRRIINNLQRTCSLFLVKTIFATIFAIISMIVMFAMRDTDFQYPFSTNNMYVWELVAIGIGALFLSIQPNSERLDSSFLKNILTKSIPAGLMQVLLSLFFFIVAFASKESILNFEAAQTMAVITFTIGGYIILTRVCLPFDIYRTVLLIAMVLIGVILFVIDRFSFYPNLDGSGFFKIQYNLVNSSNWWLLAIAIAAAIPLYVGLEFASKKVFKNVKKVKGTK